MIHLHDASHCRSAEIVKFEVVLQIQTLEFNIYNINEVIIQTQEYSFFYITE